MPFRPLIVFVIWLLSVAPVEAQRVVAVTIDDLPYAGDQANVADAATVTERMVAALESRSVPASGFVTGTNTLVDGQIDARFDLLRHWRDGGTRLENHGYAHLPYHTTPRQEYLDDVVRGHLVADRIMRERADSVRYYRAPKNMTGPTEGARDSLVAFLADRGVLLAPFTVEHADYAFDALYTRAVLEGDSARARRIGAAYLAQLDSAFTFAEEVSVATFGREIPQVFLIHANRINADYLSAMLDRLVTRGYSFVSLDEAVADPAYDTPDGYVGPWGLSWFHRWRRALGLSDMRRQEPAYPRWVIDEYQAL